LAQAVERGHRGYDPEYHFVGALLAPELELGIAKPDGVAVLQRRLPDPVAVDISAILALKVLKAVHAIDHRDRCMMARDRLMRHHQVVIERAADFGGTALA